MDKTTGLINIKRAIIHTIKNDGEIEVKTYDNELDVSKDNNKNFIIKHIQKALKSEGRKIAKFSNKDDNIILKKYNLLINNEEKFISISKEIAAELGRAMVGTNGSSTYLLITIFTKNGIESLGILKLDFVKNIELEEVNENGKTNMKLVFKDTGVPNSKQKLEKGAFISNAKLVNEKNDYDLVLLDKSKQNGTNYFKVSFLNCELVNDPRANLKNLFKTLNLYLEKIHEDNPKISFEKNRLLRDYVSSHETIDIIEISNLINDEADDEFINLCVDNKMDFEFDKDSDFYNRKCSKTRYETDTGITVEGDMGAMDDKEKIDIIEKNDGSCEILIKGLTKVRSNVK